MMDDDDDDCRAFGRLSGRENQNTERKLTPVSLWPPQISITQLGANLGSRGGKPATNCLCYTLPKYVNPLKYNVLKIIPNSILGEDLENPRVVIGYKFLDLKCWTSGMLA
jgi:hypothetical protein